MNKHRLLALAVIVALAAVTAGILLAGRAQASTHWYGPQASTHWYLPAQPAGVSWG